jgi:3'(2'), 5'-bisphosphate nucleotidase
VIERYHNPFILSASLLVMRYERELTVAIGLAREAGKFLMTRFGRGDEVRLKRDNTEVTDADIGSNRIILEGLRKEFPSDGIVSEELKRVEGEREWHVDPLDGTLSFTRGSEDFAVHIGLCENHYPVLGVVYKPSTNELYYGAKGSGAFKEIGNSKIELRVSGVKLDAMTAASTAKHRESSELTEKLRVAGVVSSINIGSTGLRIVSLADNRADVFISPSPKISSWDTCAPHAILEAAGGRMCYFNGDSILYNPEIEPAKIIVGVKVNEQLPVLQEKLVL